MENTDVFSVLSERVRRNILTSLGQAELSVSELVEHVGASQPTVSKHLRVLRDSGLVTMRAMGQRRLYRAELAPLREVSGWLTDLGVEQARIPAAHAKAPSAQTKTAQATKPAGTVAEEATQRSAANKTPESRMDRTAAEEKRIATKTQEAIAETEETVDGESVPQQISRSVGRAATKAADLLANLPKFGRRRDH